MLLGNSQRELLPLKVVKIAFGNASSTARRSTMFIR